MANNRQYLKVGDTVRDRSGGVYTFNGKGYGLKDEGVFYVLPDGSEKEIWYAFDVPEGDPHYGMPYFEQKGDK